jgi:hypothetical protein
VTLVEMGGLGGPGLRGLWIPYAVAGLLAVGAAVAVRLFAGSAGRWLAPLGLLCMVVGLCSVRVLVPSADGLVLAVPFTLLAVGAAVALTATLQEVGVGAAMFGLSLGCAGVLAGFLLGTGVQMGLLDGVRSAQELVDRFVGALHWWALIGGFLTVAVIVLAAVMARRPGTETAVGPGTVTPPGGDMLLVPAAGADSSGDGIGAGRRWGDAGGDDGQSAEESPRPGDESRRSRDVPRVAVPVPSQGAFDKLKPRRDGETPDGSGGVAPPVPPQGHSPEDTPAP